MHFCFSAKICNYTNSRVVISNMSIFFSNFSPKVLKSVIFVSEFRHFYLFTKFWNYTFCPRFRYFNISQYFPIRQIQVFWFEIWKKFFLKLLAKNRKKIFVPKNTEIRQLWYHIWALSLFHNTLELFAFKITDFNYDNSFFFNSRPKRPK